MRCNTAHAWLARGVAVLLAAGAAGLSSAQDWPVKPIRFIVGVAPGGATDILARGHRREAEREPAPAGQSSTTGPGRITSSAAS